MLYKLIDLWGACGMHSPWNLVQGNDILTGGLFGPEAGIITTFVIITSILILFSNNK
ncbi:hypothetical protein [Romboutsia weinsteinii]|uniref:hypothetical protein n=1 Tax=Romboutsia weinsteinii TaxID=2020949 RepID=UPI0013144862|nr:hypothetical protein [Romboutsia weinsteinii]